MSQDSGIHHIHFTASDIPLQSFSDFRKVSRSPIIRSIGLLAAHATVASRHVHYQLSTLCDLRRVLLPPQICSERNYVTFQNRNRNRKPVLQKEPGFGNPRGPEDIEEFINKTHLGFHKCQYLYLTAKQKPEQLDAICATALN